MTVLITLTTAGADSGPFDLYTNLGGYVSAFATGVSKSALLAGYSSSAVPDFATIIRVKSTGDCVNYIDIPLVSPTTTTTTTPSISSIPLFFTFDISGGSTRSAKLYRNNIEIVNTNIAFTNTIYVNAGDQIKVSLSLNGCISPGGYANVYCTGMITESDCNSSGAILNSSTYTVIGTEPTLTLYCAAVCDNACV